MFGRPLGNRGKFEHALVVLARARSDLHHVRLAKGEGAGLIEDHGVDRAEGFHIAASFDDGAGTGRCTARR